MHPEIEKLRELQRIDERLEILRNEVERRPAAVDKSSGEVQQWIERRDEVAELKRLKTVDLDRAKLDLANIEEKLEAANERQQKAATKSEYEGYERQMDKLESDRGPVEERIKTIESDLDLIRRAEREIQSRVGVAEEEHTDQASEVAEEIQQIQVEGQKLLAEREKIAPTVESELLEEYEMMFARYRNLVVVHVENGFCSGCHMSIAPQSLNLLRAGKTIVRCNHCTRFLYA